MVAAAAAALRGGLRLQDPAAARGWRQRCEGPARRSSPRSGEGGLRGASAAPVPRRLRARLGRMTITGGSSWTAATTKQAVACLQGYATMETHAILWLKRKETNSTLVSGRRERHPPMSILDT
uniref:Uncharacterized protein n=1 Tax=Setaria viridis TaxID=4556 RepID=A0A4U6WBS2_SETVI|nr:uncharacterized protein LOC117838895 [Setaria viridis]TKW38419.1 hypothetical protein SEVIR_1G113100v2 [Setaria viridis]